MIRSNAHWYIVRTIDIGANAHAISLPALSASAGSELALHTNTNVCHLKCHCEQMPQCACAVTAHFSSVGNFDVGKIGFGNFSSFIC